MPEELAERLRAVLAATKSPLDKIALTRRAGLKSDDRGPVRQALKKLEDDGLAVRVSGERWAVPEHVGSFVGVINFRRSGVAWIRVVGPQPRDIVVPKEHTANALPGDNVVVRESRPGSGLGRVVEVRERKAAPLVGTLVVSGKQHWVQPDDARFPLRVRVSLGQTKARLGFKVVVQLAPWPSRQAVLSGEIVEVLGPADAVGVDMLAIIRGHGLPTEFPLEVTAEAERIGNKVSPRDLAGREDFRGREVFTIDPPDARDFDDAVEVETMRDGWRLFVHIADVAHYVLPGTALDREARRRGNSVYLADRVIPMLPENLSNGLSSLMPEVDRLVFTAILDFDPEGRLKRSRFARGVIHSKRRFAYAEAFALLERSADASPFSTHMHRAWDLAAKLRARRFAGGSLDLDMPEVKVYLDARGRPLRLEKVVHDRAHQLIEEFMLAANDAVGQALKNASVPTIYRVHEDPDPEKLREYRELVRSYGHQAGDLTHRAELQRVLNRLGDLPEAPALRIGLLRSLKRATYRPEPIGHYGLAKSNYAHFTSPIRRYADLVVHRSLAQMLRIAPPGGAHSGALNALSNHISETERNAADAERESVKLKKLEFFRDRIGTPETFEAVVMDVREFGLIVELLEFGVSGRIPFKNLGGDYYQFDTLQRTVRGKKTNRSIAAGQRIHVVVAEVDLGRQEVDFAEPATPSKGHRKPPPGSARKRRRR